MTYPNPVSTSLNVKFKELTGKADLYVYNLMGQLVIREQMNEASFQIDCSQLPAGYYTLKIKPQKGTSYLSKPFVKR